MRHCHEALEHFKCFICPPECPVIAENRVDKKEKLLTARKVTVILKASTWHQTAISVFANNQDCISSEEAISSEKAPESDGRFIFYLLFCVLICLGTGPHRFLHLFIHINVRNNVIRLVPFTVDAVFKLCSVFQPERFGRTTKKPKNLQA